MSIVVYNLFYRINSVSFLLILRRKTRSFGFPLLSNYFDSIERWKSINIRINVNRRESFENRLALKEYFRHLQRSEIALELPEKFKIVLQIMFSWRVFFLNTDEHQQMF